MYMYYQFFIVTEDNLCESSYSIYDPPVYPQHVKGFLKRLWSYAFSTATFKEPDKKKEGELCFKLYLSTFFTQEQLPPDDITTFYSMIMRVYDSLRSSKKVNTQNVGNQISILNLTGEDTFESVKKYFIFLLFCCIP